MSNAVSHGSRQFRAARAKGYRYLFGPSSSQQVWWRLGVDFGLALVALLAGVVLRYVSMGHITIDSTVAEATNVIQIAYSSNVAPFIVSAMVLFVGSRLYRPLPRGMLMQRVLHIAVACGLGALVHLGAFVLMYSAPSRGVVIPSWGLLFGLAVGSRVVRSHFAHLFSVTPREKRQQSRVEDVLVVGGAGYIGSVLTRQLLAAGYRVRVLDLELFGRESLAGVLDHPRLQVQTGDFRNVEDVVRSLRGMDAVVHLAAIVGDPACALDEETTIAVNYEAAKMMAQLARANGISRFIFASTCSVYGESDATIDESSDLNPVSLYATTKIDAERVLLEAADDAFKPTILRLATAYGWSHRPRFDLVANLLSAKAVTDKDISVFNGEQWRPFVNTRDISRAIVTALESPLALVGGEIFNVGDNSQNYTISELGQIVAAAVPGTNVNDVRNDEDPRNYRVCFDKIQNTLGFRAAVTLEQGIQEIVDAVERGEVDDWRDPKYSNLKQMEATVLPILRFGGTSIEEREGLVTTREFLRRAA